MIQPISPMPLYKAGNRQYSFNQSFKGGKMDVLKYAFNKKKVINRYITAAKLEVKPSSLAEINKPLNRHKASFLDGLAEKFNRDNRLIKGFDTKEAKKTVFSIFDMVKYPSKFHRKLVRKTDYTLEQIQYIFKETLKSKHKRSLADNLRTTHSRTTGQEMPFVTLKNFLNSKYTTEINKRYKDYEPFVELNQENPGIVENLEKLIGTGTYDKVQVKKQLKINKLVKDTNMFDKIEKSYIGSIYTSERMAVLYKFKQSYYCNNPESNKNIRDNFSQSIKHIIFATNNKNFKVINDLLSMVKRLPITANKSQTANISELQKLIDIYETNNTYRKLTDALLKNDVGFNTPDEMLELFRKVSPEKLTPNIDIVKHLFKKQYAQKSADSIILDINMILNDQNLLAKTKNEIQKENKEKEKLFYAYQSSFNKMKRAIKKQFSYIYPGN